MARTVRLVAKVMTPISGNKPAIQINLLQYPVGVSRGFTLLELLIVLSIIILAMAVVIPNITGTESNVLSAQVRQTAAALNYARRIAIVQGVPQVATLIQMDPKDPDYPEIKGEIVQRASIPPLENFAAEISYQADINDEPEVLDIIQVEFFPQGGSTGGILNFTLEDLEAGILINPMTGRIAIRYPGEEFEDDAP